jgi:hypothetical protein
MLKNCLKHQTSRTGDSTERFARACSLAATMRGAFKRADASRNVSRFTQSSDERREIADFQGLSRLLCEPLNGTRKYVALKMPPATHRLLAIE